MNEIKFHSIEQPKCVMRIERDKIWVDPDIEVTEAARVVIASLEQHIKMLLAAEREKAAYLRKEVELCCKHSEDYENGFWDGLDLYEEAIRSMK